MTVLANDPARRANSQAIADLAELGWLRPEDSTLDLTIGPKAGFWRKWRPDHLVTNDLDPDVAADLHVDFRRTPFTENAFDVVVFDPDYGYRGTSRLASDAAYGLAGDYRSVAEVEAKLVHGTWEACRISRRLVLVKCQDQNVSGAFRDQSSMVVRAAFRRGFRVKGKLYVNAVRAQPKGKQQRNIWSYHSVLLVFEGT